MAESEPPITIKELVELTELEMESKGITRDDEIRSMRARLESLRATKASGMSRHEGGSAETGVRPAVSPIEARVAAVEDEVKRLRELIERKNG